jgi:hypothetical protein
MSVCLDSATTRKLPHNQLHQDLLGTLRMRQTINMLPSRTGAASMPLLLEEAFYTSCDFMSLEAGNPPLA